MWVQLNEQLVLDADARVSVFDRGFMYGEGVFETMRAYRGIVFGLDAHLDRLAESAAAIRMALPREPDQMRADIERVLVRNRLTEAVVRIAATRGPGSRGLAPPPASSGTYVVTAGPVPPDLAGRRRRGVVLKVVTVRKVPATCLPSHAKHANYLNSILAHLEAVEAGADEGLMLTVEGELAECSGSNLFFVAHGRLCTPSLEVGILPGIIRRAVLELASSAGLDVLTSRFEPDALLDSEEAFVTNSVAEILPVREIDSRELPVPGERTTRLIRLLDERIRTETAGL